MSKLSHFVPEVNNHVACLDEVLLGEHVCQNFKKVNQGDFAVWLKRVLPEVDHAAHQRQRTPWHTHNVLGHTLRAVEQMNRLTKDDAPETRRLLAYTMLFHDLGKPMTHVTRIVNGKVQDSFPNHATQSRQVFNQAACHFGFDRDAAQQIDLLIKYHDVFNNDNLLSLEANEEFAADLRAGLNLDNLLKVAKADNLAQNKKLTRTTLDRITTYQNSRAASVTDSCNSERDMLS